MRDVAIRVRKRPRRERVGAETLMDERERRLQARVGQIRKHRRELPRGQHALVGQRVRRKADDVEEAPGERVDGDRVNGRLDALADHVQLPLRLRASRFGGQVGGREHRRYVDEHLLEHRLRCLRAVANEAVVVRDVAPAEKRRAFLFDDRRNQIADRFAIARVTREKHETCAVRSGIGQRE